MEIHEYSQPKTNIKQFLLTLYFTFGCTNAIL